MFSGFRKAISCHYANGDVCKYIDDYTGSAKDELIEIAKMKFKKLGIDAKDMEYDFNDLWRLRSRSVTGQRSNL